jgi:hypothetical protein
MTTSNELFDQAGKVYHQEREQAHEKLLAEFPALVQIEADLKTAVEIFYEKLHEQGNHPCYVDDAVKQRVGQLFLDAQATGAFPSKREYAAFTRQFIPKSYRDACLSLVTPPPPPKSNTPLDNLAAKIEELWLREYTIGNDERDALKERHAREYDELAASLEPQRLPLRVEQGRLLIEARKLVPARSWEKWCRNNIHVMSQSNIRVCLALAEAEDPVAAHEAEKAKVRERVAKHRAAAKSAVTGAAGDDVTAESPSVTLPDAIARDAPLRVAAQAPEPAVPGELARDTADYPRAYLAPDVDQRTLPAYNFPEPSKKDQLAWIETYLSWPLHVRLTMRQMLFNISDTEIPAQAEAAE